MAKPDSVESALPIKEIAAIVGVIIAVAILVGVVVHIQRQNSPVVMMTVHPPTGGGKSAYLAQQHQGKWANGGPGSGPVMPAGGLAAGIDPTK